jgi:hypothetical protein
MKMTRSRLLPIVLGIAVLLTACGGGGGEVAVATTGTTPTTTTPPATTVQQSDVPVTVIDGAIQNAKVCLDKNRSNACDADEPSGITDAAGNVTLKVDTVDAGKFPIVAEVGTNAIDADHGPVGTAFVLKAPADRQSVVSPLTTLVQTTIENTGASSDAAEAVVKAQIGVSVSLFANFTQGGDADSVKLGTLARVVVVTVQEQTKVLAASVGSTASDGKPITLQDIQGVINQRLLQSLPEVVTAVGDPRFAATPAAERGQLITEIAKELVADPAVGLSSATLQTLVAVARGTDTAPEAAPTAGGVLTALTFANTSNWFRRWINVSTADAAPDSANRTRFTDRRTRSNSGAVANWSFGGDPARQTDFHWSGSAWVQCPLAQRSTSTVRDAQGRSEYNYCDNNESGVTVRSVLDVAGKAMKDVYKQVRDAAYTNISIDNADSVLGTATFPASSKLFFYANTPLSTAVAYYPGVGNQVRNTNADVASGAKAACDPISPATPVTNYTTIATTLEAMIAVNKGTPCVYQPNTGTPGSGPRNEWWAQSTVSIGTVGSASTGGTQATFYTTNQLLRVAFADNNTVRYYSCQQRASDGSARNCDLIGTGSYTITTLGDSRAMSFNSPPAQFAALSYSRVFVERGGRIYFGYKGQPTPTRQARLNLAATNAVSAQLGLPTIDPDGTFAPTAASFAGEWIVNDQAPLESTRGTTIRVTGAGTASACIDNETGLSSSCTFTVNPASGAITLSDSDGTATGTFDFETGAGSGSFTPTGGTAVAFTGMRR